MSTEVSDGLHVDEIECHHDLQDFLCRLEDDPCLFQAERLQERLIALDTLDAEFGDFNSEASATRTDSRIRGRAKALRIRLEAANAELYEFVRSEIVRGGKPDSLHQWLRNPTSQHESGSPSPGLGFDWRDELVSGVLQFREPGELDRYGLPEMFPFQPTPARHVLDLIDASLLSEDDVFVDLGSGLGHVPLLLSMLTGVQSVGVEVQAAYVDSAQECARSLRLSRARFVAADARAADFSSGTVFYLYSPFKGSILTDVLSMLHRENMRRSIKICSLGPCTSKVANETWLKTSSRPSTGRIAVFSSR
jgi:Histone methylation protein DOT1